MNQLSIREPKKCDAWDGILTDFGQMFEGGKDKFVDVMLKYQVESGYKVKLEKTDRKRYTVHCLFKEEKGCKWRFYSSLEVKNVHAFKCKTFISENSCGLACFDPSKLRMTKTFIKNVIKDDIRVSSKQKTSADIQDLFLREYQVDLTYHQAYHGLKFCKECIWGEDIKSYSNFLWYEEAGKRHNPASVIKFEFNAENRQFERFFISFEACITGFNKYCRPMLIIDDTFLTGKFRGWSYEIFPLVFGLVSGENGDNWHWFPDNLKGIVDVDRLLTIICDRGTGLLNNVPLVFPNAFQSYCSYHMKDNIPVSKGKSRQTAIKLFEQCYNVVTKEQFLKALSSMHNLKFFSIIEWMKKTPLKNWATHEFEVERFGELTSKIAESFNILIKNEKCLQAIELNECIRSRTMETMWNRKVAARKWNTRLTPKMQARLDKRITDCRKYKVRRASENVFEIITNTGKNTVDLDSQTCTCHWWKKHSFPCSHSVKVMVQIGEEEVYKHISPYYTVEYYRGMYSKPIYPVPDGDKLDEISRTKYVMPPPVGPQVGRPNSVHKRSYREKFSKKRKCGRCGMLILQVASILWRQLVLVASIHNFCKLLPYYGDNLF
ncbi:uncharacterized protein LOC113291651 [Papaver somniferum]|uniref:uncharacterized protein LOC113291651 n=1 Tax=Papaver somniferum TaxID=3469 RepID=UPI000E6F554E|nr:uncharacterized protein LOC113291651 [Papaver somniferum]